MAQEREVFLTVYVDDFNMSGPVAGVHRRWDLIKQKIKVGQPTKAGRFLGCDREVFTMSRET